MNWQSRRVKPPSFNLATNQASATFEASASRENMLSPKNARPRAKPYSPPTRRSFDQHSMLCARPWPCSRQNASSISGLIQVSRRSVCDSAQVAMTRANAVSAVTTNRSCRRVLARDFDKRKPSSGMTARNSGSIQKVSGSSRASDIGNMPLA